MKHLLCILSIIALSSCTFGEGSSRWEDKDNVKLDGFVVNTLEAPTPTDIVISKPTRMEFGDRIRLEVGLAQYNALPQKPAVNNIITYTVKDIVFDGDVQVGTTMTSHRLLVKDIYPSVRRKKVAKQISENVYDANRMVTVTDTLVKIIGTPYED